MPDVTVFRNVLRDGFDQTDLPWVPWAEPGRVGVEYVVLWGPDPAEDDSDEEGYGGGQAFDETAPGATGWITSENMHEYTDADGNFKMPEGITVIGDEDENDVLPLGEGAGRVRRAEEFDDAEEGADADQKWQKTG